jgi:regulator of protease activity HflC (stomatin/prohibitin superfamily)
LGDANALTTRAQAEGDAAKARATGEADALKTKSQAEGDAAQAKATGEASAIKLIAEAEAEKIEKVGKAQGEAYRLASQGMGPENYANIQMIKSIAENKVKLVPDTLIGAGNGGPGMSMLESLFGQTLLTRVNRSNGTNGHLTS